MEQTEVRPESATPAGVLESPPAVTFPFPPVPAAIPQAESAMVGAECPACGSVTGAMAAPSPVFAAGRIGAFASDPGVEKELAYLIGRSDVEGLTDQQALQAVLSQPENRYLARLMCWVLRIGGLDTYHLKPRYSEDIQLLIESLRPEPSPADVDVVLGWKGPVEMCNGLVLPLVEVVQAYSFKRDDLIKAIPRREKTTAKEFTPAAEQLFDQIMQMTEHTGSTDEQRALCHLAFRSGDVYRTVAEAFARNESISAVEVRPSPLTGARNVLDVKFSFTNRATDVVTKYSVSVDVTGLFPFTVRKMAPCYDW